MNLIRYNPFALRNATPADVSSVIQRFFNDAQSPAPATAENLFSPRVDIVEEPSRFVISLDLPGIDPKAVDLKLDGQVLTVQGERPAQPPVEGSRVARVERTFGQFYRRFVLPESADLNAIKATGNFGVLEIAIAKKPEAAPRKIEIV